MSEVIPDDIATFIAQRIGTVAELEGLLILRQDRMKKWDARTLATRLYLNEKQTDELLRLLCGNGLAAMEAGEPPLYSYSPASPELGLVIDRLAEVYPKHIVPVTHLIHSRPKVQGFADAFKFRKDG